MDTKTDVSQQSQYTQAYLLLLLRVCQTDA